MRKIVLAFDKFKGSATSRQLIEAARQSILRWNPSIDVVAIPVADGGEGTVEAIASTMTHVQFINIEVPGPLMMLPPVKTRYAIDRDKATAIMEMSAASGLSLVPPHQTNVMQSTTQGTGIMMCDAVARGCRHIIMGLGGSATHDCATGLLNALGFKFLDRRHEQVFPCGENLAKIVEVDDADVPLGVKKTHFTLYCDVKSPLYGAQGAAQVFAAQKGATPKQIELLEQGSMSFSKLMPAHVAATPGTGAAGGTGAGMMAFLNAQLKCGADAVLDFLQFDKLIAGADVIFTGEGRIDTQTIMGKAPGEVLKAGHKQGIPVIALCGTCDTCITDGNSLGFDAIVPITPSEIPLEKSMRTEVCLHNLQVALTHTLHNLASCQSAQE